jgi:hypothetical protein
MPPTFEEGTESAWLRVSLFIALAIVGAIVLAGEIVFL